MSASCSYLENSLQSDLIKQDKIINSAVASDSVRKMNAHDAGGIFDSMKLDIRGWFESPGSRQTEDEKWLENFSFFPDYRIPI